MTHWTLIRRSLWHHARAHAGALLGVTLSAAALTGALLVGDSIRGTLLNRALERLGPITHALYSPDRFFLQDFGARTADETPAPNNGRHNSKVSAGLLFPGSVSKQDGTARLNAISVIGVDPLTWPALANWDRSIPQSNEWSAGELALINRNLAEQMRLQPADKVIVRMRKPTALSQDAVISPRDENTIALRLTIGLLPASGKIADFSLAAHQLPAANVFIPLPVLQRTLGLSNRANLLVWAGPPQPADNFQHTWRLEDAQLSFTSTNLPQVTGTDQPEESLVELATPRIFLDNAVVQAALAVTKNSAGVRVTNEGGAGVLTYLANLIQTKESATPYSMVTAAGSPFVPAEMADNEILINEWLARDLKVSQGDELRLSYYVADSASRLVERTNTFKVRAIVPISGIYADRTLMPEFPGLAKAESTHDWDAGFPLKYTIRPQDEAYWKSYRGTPKAFITLAAGQKMWANRFGSLTSVRWAVPANELLTASNSIRLALEQRVDPSQTFGFRYQPVREMAFNAAAQSQDFGQLFLGFSFFLILSALLLTALLYHFAIEQRSGEIGTLLALGFTPAQVRRLLLFEGVIISCLGGFLGALAGIGYAKSMLWALVTRWRQAVGTPLLEYHATPRSWLIGAIAGSAVAALTIWLTLRKQARQPAAVLLSGPGHSSAVETRFPRPGKPLRLTLVLSLLCPVAAVVILAAALMKGETSPGAFFGAGSLLLISGLLMLSWRLKIAGTHARAEQLTLAHLALRGTARRRHRSLATIALLACGTFVIVSVGVFRLDAAKDAREHKSGTGGFALIGQSTLPVLQDLNTQEGRDALGLSTQDLQGLQAVPLRVREGEDASCLNLNRAQRPRLLGVAPELLAGRFNFTKVAPGFAASDGWKVLQESAGGAQTPGANEVPAVGDANSIQWALGKKVGDSLDYTDEQGRSFKLRLVGAVANSILQGSLVINEQAFTRKFQSQSGYRFFLIDSPSNAVSRTASELSRGLQDYGFEVVSASERLQTFNAVQNTYLGTFQLLGGLGLLLGSAGLGVVVLRNVLERRGEMALLSAVGFKRSSIQRLLLLEHGALLLLGLGVGLVSAMVSVLPQALAPGSRMPIASLAITLAAVLLNGALWTWAATAWAAHGNLLQALRND